MGLGSFAAQRKEDRDGWHHNERPALLAGAQPQWSVPSGAGSAGVGIIRLRHLERGSVCKDLLRLPEDSCQKTISSGHFISGENFEIGG